MLTLLMDILYPLISVLTILIPVLNFTFFVEINKKIITVYTFLFYLVVVFLYVTNVTYFSTLLLFIGAFIYLFLIYNNIYISIIISVFIDGFLFLCDSITGFLFMCIFDYQYSTLMSNHILYFILGITVFLFSYIFSKLIRIIILRLLRKVDVNLKFPQKFNNISISILVILILTFSTYVFFLKQNINISDKYIVSVYAISSSFFVLSAVILIYYGFKTLINNYKLKEYTQLKDYTIMIENMYTDLRSFKHDYLNILSSLETFIQNHDINGLKNYYYHDLLPESNIIIKKDISLSFLSHVKINPLKALLFSKISNAHSKGIDVKIELTDDIYEINMNSIHICRIIGILIDNAIEGSILCENKFIHFAIIKTTNQVIFNIANSCLNSTPPVYKIYQKNFSTKGDDRGIGLYSVRSLIDNHYKNAILNTSIENCVFKQELIIND